MKPTQTIGTKVIDHSLEDLGILNRKLMLKEVTEEDGEFYYYFSDHQGNMRRSGADHIFVEMELDPGSNN